MAEEVTDDTYPPEQRVGLDEVFRLVHEREGIDLCAYRQKTVERRVTSRFQKLRCQDYAQYAALVAADPAETRHLVEHITIKVSRFFRDAAVCARLREEVLPSFAQRYQPSGQARIWSAGCGNGEEAYSMAIMVDEMAGQGGPVLAAAVWGTDVDESALAVARQGIYPENSLSETPPEIAATYFTRQQGRFGYQYELDKRVRESVRFLRHDLLSGSPVAEGRPFDLVLCRNVLIYFERRAQERVLDLLAASIVPGGYLCLGEAEHLGRERQSSFETIDRQLRLFRRI